MPETVSSVSDLVHDAVTSAVSQASGSNPADGASDAAPQTSAGVSPAPADASGTDARTTAPSTTGGPTIEGVDADDELVKDNNVWNDVGKRSQVLRNARTREAEKITKDLESRLGFRLSDENTLRNIQAYLADPPGYLRKYGEHFGLIPAAANGHAQAPPQNGNGQKPNGFTRPQPQYRTEDGKAVYGQEEIDAITAEYEQRLARVEQSITPLQSTHDQLEQARITYQAQQEADRIYRDVQTWPRYEDIKDDMAKLLMSDGRVTPESAYGRIMRERYPTFLQKTRQEVLDELKAKPAAPASKATPAAQARSSSTDRKRGLSVSEAVLAAVEKHSATR
jgi:hypothetical protein